MVERAGSILQENEDLDVSSPFLPSVWLPLISLQTKSVFDTFLSAQESGDPGALDILRPLRLRYFTPSELLTLFAFDADSFIWPPHITVKTKYRLIGNSVNVLVVTHLIRYLLA
jgi:tRNA (cytosine38-C5)-methyltransferase